jgi:cation diffusion facilitator CzcD-associated flavoprotein CzcO
VTDFDAIVIGAGFSGLYMLHRLREMGCSALVIERAADVGGTWWWNRYPGARCDVESMTYSYSWDPQLEQEWSWTEKYPAQPEILRYIEHVADRHDLRRDIEFETVVTTAIFDEAAGVWTVTTDRGAEYRCCYLIAAVGCLSHPKPVDIAGVDEFEGESYHTATWPHEGVDLAGKRVAVIGTGSTGIQVIPEVAKVAESVIVFQRTAHYSMPAGNRPLTEEEIADRKADYPAFREALRKSSSGNPPLESHGSALVASEDERRALYEKRWGMGRPTALVSAYSDIMTDVDANETAAQFVRDKIAEIVDDPEVAAVLQPTTFPIGTKRPCLDTDYYTTFNRANVTLVDASATPIETVTPTGIRTSDAEHRVDVIIYATGFDAMVGALNQIDIRGRGDRSLRDEWGAGPRTYLGLSVAGFPNLFMITGPGSPSVLSNMIISIEQHVDWIAACVEQLRARGLATIEATEQAQDHWVDHVREVADRTLFPAAESWYMGANVPGKPRVFLPYVGGVGRYREICDEVAAAGYEGFRLS